MKFLEVKDEDNRLVFMQKLKKMRLFLVGYGYDLIFL